MSEQRLNEAGLWWGLLIIVVVMSALSASVYVAAPEPAPEKGCPFAVIRVTPAGTGCSGIMVGRFSTERKARAFINDIGEPGRIYWIGELLGDKPIHVPGKPSTWHYGEEGS